MQQKNRKKQTGELSGVTTSTLDFVSKKLMIEVEDDKQLPSIVEQATQIVNRLEPDVEVIKEDSLAKGTLHEDHRKAEMRSKILRISIGGILTGIAAFCSISISVRLFFICSSVHSHWRRNCCSSH
ncbi:hypothetical protein GCM10020331_097730 [Ectobacillus funiculus]